MKHNAKRFVREYAAYINSLNPALEEQTNKIIWQTERGRLSQIEAIKVLTRIACYENKEESEC